MTWRLPQLILLTLVAVAWPLQARVAAAPAGSRACHRTSVERENRAPNAPGEAESPGLHQAGWPMDCLLCGERPGQLRLELRQPGVETWIGPAACGVASTFAIWAWRIRPALTTASHLRLHVLHCTWLI